MRKDIILHLSALLILFLLEILGIFSEYHQGNFARILVLAAYGVGYNILFGYTGLLSLGHALFFSAGLNASGLSIYHLDYNIEQSLFLAICISALISLIIGFLALRTIGVSFMIVTLMFSQIAYLSILYFGSITRGDEGFVIQQSSRVFLSMDLSNPKIRYYSALLIFSLCMLINLWIAKSPFGRVLVAIRENSDRALMLGYNVKLYKLFSIIISGTISGLAGACYGILFGYVGASFAAVSYSIFPLLWVLIGGAGTVLGPLIGAIFMFYLIDYASDITDAYMIIVGVALLFVTLFARRGIIGELRFRYYKWIS
jgi:branched-chain amino acid transport system permease protein